MVKGYMVFDGEKYPIELKENKTPEEWNKKPQNYKKSESKINLEWAVLNTILVLNRI
jgi:hypothetical protein